MTDKQQHFDVVILGGGGAGLMAALTAGQRGKRTLVVEKSNKLGKKILMSGGGRCNFTNLDIQPHNFICNNPHFVKSALAQYTQWDFIALVAKHDIAWHEKKHGQLFCDHSAKDILNMLVRECEDAGVTFELNRDISSVSCEQDHYLCHSEGIIYTAPKLIVATGGLSIPTLGGASGLGYRIAEQFGLTVNPTEASLVPFTLTGKWLDMASRISGVSVPVLVSVPGTEFSEDMLFTHRGLSGPAILQLSNYWYTSDEIIIDLMPHSDQSALAEQLLEAKRNKPNSLLKSVCKGWLPAALLQELSQEWWPELQDKPLQEIKNDRVLELVSQLKAWHVKPSGTEGYRTAEVTRGGVDTAAISSGSMQVKAQPGLFFIGEVIDVTGHLGGYNFQWAWSSGYAAGMNV